METKFQIINQRNYKLNTILFTKEESPNIKKKIIILIHGYCGDKINGGYNAIGYVKERFRKMANALLCNGFEVISFDLSGHGENKREILRIPHFILDVEAVYNWVTTQGYTDIGTLAYSMGSLASIQAILPKRKVAVFWSPAFHPGRSKNKILVLFIKIISLFYKKPRNDGANFKDVIVDVHFLNQSIKGISDKEIQNFNVPTLMIHGKDDKKIEWKWSKEVFDKMKRIEKKKYVLIKGAEHHFHKEYLDQFINESLKWFQEYL